MVHVKHQLFKNCEKCVKQETPIHTAIKVGFFFTPKWNIDFLLGGIHIGKKKDKKINFFVVFFVKKTMKAKIVNNEKH